MYLYSAVMKAMDVNLRNETVRWQEKLFKRSVRRKLRLTHLKELLGTTSNQNCLEITSGDGVISSQLRESGGTWRTLAVSDCAAASVDYFIEGNTGVLNGIAIDVPEHTFDVVVIVDALEYIRDDHGLIKECHRVLKPDGRLVLTAARRPLLFSLSAVFRALFRLSWKARGLERAGYSPQEFFDVLKDGFDVPDTGTYTTGSIEIPGIIFESCANKLAGRPYSMPPPNAGNEEFYIYTRLYSIATFIYPLMWVALKINAAVQFLPGNNIIAKTKRRVWRLRKQPVLIDGRSIAEAAINTKIGTAAPF